MVMSFVKWSCASCFKTFRRKGDLTRHELLHTGIRPHVCETCGKSFAQYSGLKTHWNVHSKAKPYSCGIGTCAKAFGDPSSRARHRKETHRREGAYKCIVADCGTRIKRRSAFVAHLRKHGFDTNSLDLDAVVLQSGGGGVPAPAHSASPDLANESNHGVQSRSVSPSFLSDSSGSYTLANSSGMTRLLDEWPGDLPLDCRWLNLPPANDTMFPVLDQTVNVGSGIPHDVYSYLPGSLEDLSCFDDIFPTATDYPLLITSPLGLPVLLKAGMDISQLSSSPSSTYSALYAGDFDDDVITLSLANNASQESFLYNIN